MFFVQARHIYICDYHKDVIQKARTKRRRKDSEDDSNETDTDLPEVDLFQLQVNTLRRYKRHYKVSTRPGMNKAQLADVSAFVCEEYCHVLNQFPPHPPNTLTVIQIYPSTVSQNDNDSQLFSTFFRQHGLIFFFTKIKYGGNENDGRNILTYPESM